MWRAWEEGHAPYPGRPTHLPETARFVARRTDGWMGVSRGHMRAAHGPKARTSETGTNRHLDDEGDVEKKAERPKHTRGGDGRKPSSTGA